MPASSLVNSSLSSTCFNPKSARKYNTFTSLEDLQSIYSENPCGEPTTENSTVALQVTTSNIDQNNIGKNIGISFRITVAALVVWGGMVFGILPF